MNNRAVLLCHPSTYSSMNLTRLEAIQQRQQGRIQRPMSPISVCILLAVGVSIRVQYENATQHEGTDCALQDVRYCVQGVPPNSVTFATLLTRQNEQGRLDLVRPTLDHMHQVRSTLCISASRCSLFCVNRKAHVCKAASDHLP